MNNDVTVYLVSNACTDIYENTLSSFKNDLPQHLLQHYETGTWELALSEVQFENTYRNKCAAPDKNMPTVVIVEKEESLVDISDLPETKKIYLTNRKMTQFDLTRLFMTYESNPTFLAMKYDTTTDKVYLQYPRRLVKKDCIWIHPNFVKYLFGDESMSWPYTIRISGRLTYWVFDPEHWNYAPFRNYARLYVDRPLQDYLDTFKTPLVFVRCKEVQQQPYSKQFANVIGTVPINVQNTSKYVHKEFEHRHFSPLNVQSLKSLSLEFTDIDGDKIGFTKGTPSVIKIVLRKTKMDRESQLIRVSSINYGHISNNSKNKFEVELPRPLPFAACKVALSAITFPCTFQNNLCQEERTLIASYYNKVTKQTSSFNVVILNDAHNLDEICRDIEVSHNFQVRVDVDAKTNSLKFICADYQKLTLEMGISLYHFLGGERQHESRVKIETEKNVVFSRPPLFETTMPTNLFIYSNLIENGILGSKGHPILRIVPITNQQYGTYVCIDMKHLDFKPCILKKPQHFSFEIRDASGQLIKFRENENEPCLLDLVFHSD